MYENVRENRIEQKMKFSFVEEDAKEFEELILKFCSKHGQVFIEEGVAVDVSIFKYSDGEYSVRLSIVTGDRLKLLEKK